MAIIGIVSGILALASIYILIGAFVWSLLAALSISLFIKVVIMVFVISTLVFYPAIMMGNSYEGEV